MGDEAERRRKLEQFASQTLYRRLSLASQEFIKEFFLGHRLTFQELQRVVTAERDLSMWEEPSLETWWRENREHFEEHEKKAPILSALWAWFDEIKSKEKIYEKGRRKQLSSKTTRVERVSSEKRISGLCPVASADTICCRLRTIDAVETCPFGCTYCSIQTFYGQTARFDRDFGKKLAGIELDPSRFYHYGSGQSSDSLVWGNRYGLMDDLLHFASSNPNVLLELKTKSTKIDALIDRDVPRNVVCSWSLNTDTIVENEEIGTPPTSERLSAARSAADRGVKVAFHFHPMVWYRGWKQEYCGVADEVLRMFDPREVVFISFGSVTLIKPVIRALRLWGGRSKILQMPMARDPKGKVTYPDVIKISLFKALAEAFAPWKDEVFFYLCMEKASIWKEVFGFVYESNEAFERDFGRRIMSRL
jgi:spore photoproduct lyase